MWKRVRDVILSYESGGLSDRVIVTGRSGRFAVPVPGPHTGSQVPVSSDRKNPAHHGIAFAGKPFIDIPDSAFNKIPRNRSNLIESYH